MSATLDSLTNPLTVDEVKAAIYDAIGIRGVDTTAWKTGGVVRTMIAGVAIVLAAMSVLIALIARSGFLTLSEGVWLTLVARYIYNTERIEGTFAAGTVTVDNASGSVYALGVGDLVFLNSTTGATYRNTALVNIGALETGVAVAVQADQIGSAGDAAATEIDAFVTPLLGLTCTNAAAITGTDEENDEALTTRALAFTGSLSPNGPADAYRYFATSATRSDGTSIGVTRVKATPDGAGGITVLVATATGAVTGTEGDPLTDLGAVHQAMELNAVPLCVTLTTASATPAAQNVTAEVWIDDSLSLTDAAINVAVLASVTTFVNSLPIGGVVIPPSSSGYVYLQALESAITNALSGYVVDLSVTAPAGDVLVGASAVPVMGTFSLTIHRVAV